jgi:hypothetical protein
MMHIFTDGLALDSEFGEVEEPPRPVLGAIDEIREKQSTCNFSYR